MAEFKFELKVKFKFYAILEPISKIIDCVSTTIEGQRRPCGFGPHSGEAALGPTGNSKHRTFRVSVSQSGPQPARYAEAVQSCVDTEPILILIRPSEA